MSSKPNFYADFYGVDPNKRAEDVLLLDRDGDVCGVICQMPDSLSDSETIEMAQDICTAFNRFYKELPCPTK